MKETLYRFLGERNPRAKARYEALRQAGAPRWKAAPALLLPGGGGARPLPVGAGESAQSLGEPPAVLVQRLARFQAVSFDVFDTLLLRQVERPQEAFALVGAKLGYPDFQRLRVEAERRARDMSAVVGSLYRGVVNGKLHNGSQAYSPLYEYGYVYGGLFALGYCRFIRAWAEHSGADRLLFLSRDGEALLA